MSSDEDDDLPYSEREEWKDDKACSILVLATAEDLTPIPQRDGPKPLAAAH